LLRRAALPVDRDRRNGIRELRGENHIATKGEGLFTRLNHAADYDVIDRRRVDTGSINQRVEYRRAEVGRVNPNQGALSSSSTRGAKRFDDIGFGHTYTPVSFEVGSREIEAENLQQMRSRRTGRGSCVTAGNVPTARP